MSTAGTASAPRITRVEDVVAWDDFIARQATATFCHLAGWREVMADALGHEWLGLVAVDGNGAWQAILPLVRMRSRLFGHHLVSMPFLNYGGASGDAAASAALTRAAVAEAEASGARRLELRSLHPVPAPGLAASREKITVVLELPDRPEMLWKGFPSKLRSQVRRPLKEGMTTRFGTDQVEPFYEVFSRNMRDLGTPVLPRRLFERIAGVFGDVALFGAVYHGEVPVAAGCGFLWGNEFEMTWASSLREYARSAPNMLLYWSFMEEVAARGARTFNFGRCTPGGGTHRFKLQWGGHDVPLPWTRWPAEGGHEPPSAESPVFRLATSAWSRMPLAAANRLGPVLARRIPTF